MKSRKHTQLLREGDYVAEVDVELVDDDPPDVGWGPYLLPSDAFKLDDVRRALRAGDLTTAGRLARVFRITPISAA